MEIRNLTFDYGAPLYCNFSLSVPDHAITAILGGSGTGKSTLLNLICGLLSPQSGTVEATDCSYIFQTPRLLPSLSVLDNVRAVLPKGQKDAAEVWLKRAELGDSLRLYPHQLSGGMAQRVSLARAFAVGRDTLLMDEPFTGLDLALTERLKGVLLSLWQETKPTTLLVTHDLEGALSICHHVVVLGGKPVQVAYAADVDPSDRQEVLAQAKAALLKQ